jgi:hypothetical protein
VNKDACVPTLSISLSAYSVSEQRRLCTNPFHLPFCLVSSRGQRMRVTYGHDPQELAVGKQGSNGMLATEQLTYWHQRRGDVEWNNQARR